MTPTDLKNYLLDKKQASLNDLAIHFDTSPDMIQAAIAPWLRKGKVSESTAKGCSKGCCECDPAKTTVYRWIAQA